jgi:hypothetical protein
VLAKEVQEDGMKVHLISPDEIAEMVEYLVIRKRKGTIDHLYIRRQSGLAFD